MHKRIICWRALIGFVLLSFQSSASATHLEMNNNEISITALGKGGWWSIDYARTIGKPSLINIDAIVSVASYSIKDFENRFNPNLVVPIGLRMQYGKKHNLLSEVGVSFQRIVVFDKEKTTKLAIDPFWGLHYRRHFMNSFFIQAGLFLLPIKQQKVYIWPGFSLGLRF